MSEPPATSSTTAPRPRWRRMFRRCLFFALLALFAFCAYGAWREYDFRQAIKEAKALEWNWTYDDPWEAIRADWKAAFRKKTWTEGARSLEVGTVNDYARDWNVIERVAPRRLGICPNGLRDLTSMPGLSSVDHLDMFGCAAMQSCVALRNFPRLRTLSITDANALATLTGLDENTDLEVLYVMYLSPETLPEGRSFVTNIDALKNLTNLQSLRLDRCTGITNVDSIRGLAKLDAIDLRRCTKLANIDGLKALTNLTQVDLRGCTALKSVDVLKGLTQLKYVVLYECDGLTNKQYVELRAALPNADIRGPDYAPPSHQEP